MAKPESNQILLLAPSLLGESLALQLTSSEPSFEVFLRKEQLGGNPSLVIWVIENIEITNSVEIEVKRLKEYWHPAPILIIVPSSQKINSSDLIASSADGVLHEPDLNTLSNAIKTIIKGGRVVKLREDIISSEVEKNYPIGLGEWLLYSGLEQINKEIKKINKLFNSYKTNAIQKLFLIGRKRELRMAKRILFWLWGPIHMSFANHTPKDSKSSEAQSSEPKSSAVPQYALDITITERNSYSILNLITNRLEESMNLSLKNETDQLLAFEALNYNHQKSLLLTLLRQFKEVFINISTNKSLKNEYHSSWLSFQMELRQVALKSLSNNYIRLPLNGNMTAISQYLIAKSDLSSIDEDLPSIDNILEPLLFYKPVVIDGQLLPPDNPKAIVLLEMHLINWIVRTAEIISQEALECSSKWPELRRYLLSEALISTRELERMRNQLNAQSRFIQLIKRPIQLYESKRMFYNIKNGRIITQLVTEPRDEELRQLSWLQQQVTLIVETRDALAPQIQTLLQKIGDIMVIILTKVVGRSIGLIGRGIAQGMGKTLGRG